MLKIAVAQCDGVDAHQVGHAVVQECLRQLGTQLPTAGILFANDELDHQLLLREIRSRLPTIDLVGCCTAGEISSCAGYSDDSVCLMLICGDTVEIGSGFGEEVSLAPEKAARNAVTMARSGLQQEEKLCLVFGDGLVGKQTGIIAYLNGELAESCGIFGGMSGLQRYHYDELQTSQFFGDRLLRDSVVILLLAGEIEWTYTLCNSWKPIGASTITREVAGNAVTRIGERSALDFFRHYLGPHSHPATEHPFAVYEDGVGEYYLRVPTGYDEESGSISFPVPLPLGAKIQITESSRERALRDIRASFAETRQIQPDLALIFSCDIRKNIFGTRAGEELQTIIDHLPASIPIIGFYTLGEVAPLSPGGKSIIHHCTLVVLQVRIGAARKSADDLVEQDDRPGAIAPPGIPIPAEHSVDFLERQLKRERYYRKALEENKEIIVNLFRILNQELKSKNEELFEIRRELENRVAERTADLVLANSRLQAEIAERIRTFQQKETLEKQLYQAQKMEALGTLAGGIAHDFNNILTPILGYTEMVIRNMPAESGNREELGNVLEAGNRAKKLIEQILLFSRNQEQEMVPLKIQPILKETLKLLRSSIPKTITIRQKIDPGCGCILAEPTQIHQVIMNLCTNAYHAMEDKGGVLDIKLNEQEITNANQEKKGPPPGSWLHLAVGDSGCGMDEEILERIFDPYFTTKEKGKGTGLGLAVTHGIISKYHGHITVQSQPETGTTVHIYLPLMQGDVSGQEDVDPLADLPTGSEHILLVDDEPMIVDMYRSVLQSLGYRVTGRTDSVAALELFLADQDAFQLMILDHTMPGMTGEIMARLILTHRPAMPIILTTGYSALISIDHILEAGIRRCLTKPISFNLLAETIREVIDQGKPEQTHSD